jgi:hypothetical protein
VAYHDVAHLKAYFLGHIQHFWANQGQTHFGFQTPELMMDFDTGWTRKKNHESG